MSDVAEQFKTAISPAIDEPVSNIPEWAIGLIEHVDEFNETHASVIVGGKHRIMRTVPGGANSHGRETYEFIPRKELSLVHDHTKIKIGEKVLRSEVVDIFSNHIMAWAKNKNARFLYGRDYFQAWREGTC